MGSDQEDLYLSYCDLDIIENEVKYIQENKEDFDYIEDFEEENLFNICCENSDLFNNAWDYFKEELTELMKEYDKEKTNKYFITGEKMGWRNRSGEKYLKAENGEELLKGILPNTNEFSLWVYKKKGYITIKCSHHDSPTGEFYFINPITEEELNQINEDEFY